MGFEGGVARLLFMAIFLALATNIPSTTKANRTLFSGHFSANEPKKVIVGGDEHWHFGIDYFEWAFKAGPFFENDTLVFKYKAPTNGTFPHSVYEFDDFRSFMNCDLSKAKMVASPTQGVGDGFEVVLGRRTMPYLFACGERDGLHCRVGKMKFAVMPFPRFPFPCPPPLHA